MNKVLNFLLIFFSFGAFSQNAFTLNLVTNGLEKDSLIISPPAVSNGFEVFYDFKIHNAFDLKAAGMIPFAGYFLKISGADTFKGSTSYPVPVALIRLQNEGEVPVQVSSEFYIEGGMIQLKVPDFKNKVSVNASSPTNLEHEKLRLLLKPTYAVAKNPMEIDSLVDFTAKKNILEAYIRENPESYVALWEVIKDYQRYISNGLDFSILEGFSPHFKASKLFAILSDKIHAERKSQIGDTFPEVVLDETINLDFFKNYRLSLIDYWSSTCRPCISSMPKVVSLHKEYLDKGLNIVGIVDDKDFDRKELANNHLLKNNVEWKNYFDDAARFKNAVNAMGYPLYFLVNNKGKIIYRGSDLDNVKEIIKEILN